MLTLTLTYLLSEQEVEHSAEENGGCRPKTKTNVSCKLASKQLSVSLHGRGPTGISMNIWPSKVSDEAQAAFVPQLSPVTDKTALKRLKKIQNQPFFKLQWRLEPKRPTLLSDSVNSGLSHC